MAHSFMGGAVVLATTLLRALEHKEAQVPLFGSKEKEMKILVAGSHGMIGSALIPYLVACGHQVSRLVRQASGSDVVWWDPDAGQLDCAGLEGFDGVVHLASMRWPFRWTAKAQEKTQANRLGTNHLLANSLAACTHKPQVLICAPGMGYYPSSCDRALMEDSPAGTGFLAKLQQAGEAATALASKAGIRVVHLRIPSVLGGRALQFVGFQAGDGQQWMSWIGRDELVSIIEFALRTEALIGPVNAVSPNPMRNAEFAATSTQALGQKPRGAMPALLVRLFMGEMGQEFLLASRRMQPAKLLAAAIRFASLILRARCNMSRNVCTQTWILALLINIQLFRHERSCNHE